MTFLVALNGVVLLKHKDTLLLLVEKISRKEPAASSTAADQAQGEPAARGAEQLEPLEITKLMGEIRKGENLAAAMARKGLQAEQRGEIIRALSGTFNFRRCQPEDQFEVQILDNGNIAQFVYRASAEEIYAVERTIGGLVARKVSPGLSRAEQLVIGVVTTSLYEAVEAAGENPGLAVDMAEIFAWDIDFFSQTRKGDTFSLLVEKLYADGSFLKYGRIVAAQYSGEASGLHQAFYFVEPGGKAGYYDAAGRNLQKSLLRAPLKFSRISSRFGKRIHPIRHYSQLHKGIDYAAPKGTPVWSVGDGVVKFAGRNGPSGKLLKLRHPGGYETVYAHLSAIAKGVRAGTAVRQKQIIGYVGSTGLSTGPHLHYELKKAGRHLNPLTTVFPSGAPVAQKHMSEFMKAVSEIAQRLFPVQIASEGGSAGQAAAVGN